MITNAYFDFSYGRSCKHKILSDFWNDKLESFAVTIEEIEEKRSSILKNNILKKVKKAAINFHPGPPEYRGTGCVNYALYENSKFYGCTAHLINEKVDNGKIIDVKKFNINKKDSISEVLTKTYKTMYDLAISTIKNIKKNADFIENQILKNKDIKWSNKIKNIKI